MHNKYGLISPHGTTLFIDNKCRFAVYYMVYEMHEIMKGG